MFSEHHGGVEDGAGVLGRALHLGGVRQSDPRSGELWACVAGSLRERIAVLDGRGVIVEVNEAWRKAARDGGAPHDFLGTDYLAVCAAAGDAHADQAGAAIRAVLAGEETQPVPYPMGDRWYLMTARAVEDHRLASAVVVHSEVTDETAAERASHECAQLLDEIDVAVAALDAEGRVVAWNSGAERVFGWPREDAVGMAGTEVLAVDPQAGGWRESSTRPGEELLVMRRRDGSRFPARHRLVRRTTAGRPVGAVAVTIDSTEEAKALHEVAEAGDFLQATMDSMTEGLFVLDEEGRLVMMNDAAETMLGWRFEELREVVLHEVVHHRRADGSPHPIDDCPISDSWRNHVTVRVKDDVFIARDGVALPVSYAAAPIAGQSGCVVVFGDATQTRAEESRLRRELEDLASTVRIREALADDRLEIFAQPIVRVATGEVVQHELLLRVPDPDGVLGSPVSFLADAERLGLGGAVDRWVVRRGLEAARGASVELNLSAASLSDTALLDDIAAGLGGLGVDPSLVVFEITETAFLADLEAGRVFVGRLRDLGCRIALDDFGTGYGGFTYLKKLPVDYLKIDTEFVVDLVDNEASRHVVRAVVHLAQSFGLQTVAEGVEDQETWELLRDLRVDLGQGYHLGRPRPLSEALGVDGKGAGP